MGLCSKQVIGGSLHVCSQERCLEIPRIDAEVESQQKQQMDKAAPMQCPRCDSRSTKFCYYNNYSKLQPRHFCKACRRYWTAGGVLRDVPVGGSRKNKRRLKTAHDDDTSSCSTAATVAAGQHLRQQPLLMPLDACPEAFLHEALLLRPPQLKSQFASDRGAMNAGSYVESVPSAALLLPTYFAWVEEPAAVSSYTFEDMFDLRFSSSSSCSSPLDDCARRDMGDSVSVQDDHLGSYLSCWDEGFDFVDLELKAPGSDN